MVLSWEPGRIRLATLLVGQTLQSDSQANGSSVLQHMHDLRPYLQSTFEGDVVRIDIAAYSGETFYSLLAEFLDEVRQGLKRPHQLHVRMVVPDCSRPMAVPCLKDTLCEHPSYKDSIQSRTQRFASELRQYFLDIDRQHTDVNASLEIRMHRFSPLFKMIRLSDSLAFFGLYPIAETPVGGADPAVVWDYRGERCVLVRASAHGSKTEQQLSESLQEWFTMVWDNLSTPLVAVEKR